MSYLAHIHHLYHAHIQKKNEEPRFIILTSFTITFIIARLIVYGIMNHVLPKPFGYVTVDSLHIHHIVFGVLLLLIAGFIRIPQFGKTLLRISSMLYGIGAALTLDEFALLIHFNPRMYLNRLSLDAVFVFFLLCLGFLWHGSFWSRIFALFLSSRRKHRP